MPWDTTVATAAPATPIWNQRIKEKSRKILRMDDSARKYTGVLLSPSARMMPASRL